MIKQPSILLFLIFFIAGFCQKNNTKIENLQNFDKQKLHFGYFIGFNQYNYKLDYKIILNNIKIFAKNTVKKVKKRNNYSAIPTVALLNSHCLTTTG